MVYTFFNISIETDGRNRRIVALKDLRMTQALFLGLCVFTYIVSTPIVMPTPFFLEPELGHDGTEQPTNGWWKLVSNNYSTGDGDVQLKSSDTGCWIHYSVLAMDTRNYGGQKLVLRKSPDAKSAVVYQFTEEIMLRPMDIKGDWVKVKTVDGKFTGWIEEEWLCGNALTNCC